MWVCELQAVTEYYDMYQTRKMSDGSLSLSIDFVVIDGVVVGACCWYVFCSCRSYDSWEGHNQAQGWACKGAFNWVLISVGVHSKCQWSVFIPSVVCCQIKEWASAVALAEKALEDHWELQPFFCCVHSGTLARIQWELHPFFARWSALQEVFFVATNSFVCHKIGTSFFSVCVPQKVVLHDLHH